MKFILNETKKFILEEKFILKEDNILVEASAADVAVKWTAYFKSTLGNARNVLQKYIEFAGVSASNQDTKTKFTKIKDTIKKAAGEIEVSLSMPESDRNNELLAIKAELDEYVKALQVVATEITDKKSKDTITLLTSKIKDLIELNAKDAWDKSDVEDLGEVLAWVEEKVYPLFDTTSIDSQASTAEEFKAVCKDCLELSKEIEESLPETFTEFDEATITNYINIMKTAAENTKLPDAGKVNKGLIIANLETYFNSIKILKQNYEKINQSSALNISRTKAKEKAEAEKAEQEKRAQEEEERINPTVDWAELYKTCSETQNKKDAYNAFWNGGLPLSTEDNPNNLPVAANEKIKLGYFAGEWGKHAALVKSFGTVFIKSLQEFGWSATLNPLVDLLKHLFKLKEVLITDSTFSQIREAFGRKILSDKDLRGKGIFGELNLVRTAQFYSKSATEVAAYLTWQNEVKTSEKIPSDSDIKVIYANIAAENGNSTNLKDEATLDALESSAFQYKPRPLTKYKEIIKTSFDVDGDREQVTQATDEEISAILAKITTKELAKKFMAYLVNLYRITNLNLLTKLLGEPFGTKLKANRDAVSTSFEEDKKFDTLLKPAARKYSEAQLKTLITKLVEIAGL